MQECRFVLTASRMRAWTPAFEHSFIICKFHRTLEEAQSSQKVPFFHEAGTLNCVTTARGNLRRRSLGLLGPIGPDGAALGMLTAAAQRVRDRG
jgi:hypothetical protein